MSNSFRAVLLSVSLAVPTMFSSADLRAANIWDAGGGASTNINTATNWDNNTVPLFDGSQVLTFGTAGTTATLNVPISVTGLVVNRGGNFLIDGPNTVTIGASGIVGTGGAAIATFGAPIELAANQTWDSGRNYTVNSVVSETGGSRSLTIAGLSGTRAVTMNGANAYSGATLLGAPGGSNGAVTFRFAVAANGGSASSFGQSSNSAANLILTAVNTSGGVMLDYVGTADGSSDRLMTFATGISAPIYQFNVTNNVTMAWTNPGAIVYSGFSGNQSVLLRFGGAGTTDLSLELNNPTGSTGSLGFNVNSAPKLILRNINNSFTGSVLIADNGVIEITNITNSGLDSALGAGSSLGMTPGVNNGFRTLRQIDSPGFSPVGDSSTNRSLTFSSTAGGITSVTMRLENDSATRGLIFAPGTFTQGGSNAGTIAFGGSNTGNNQFQRAINNGTMGGVNSVLKDGAGKWTLTADNAYTGSTLISGGTLAIDGAGDINQSSGITISGAGARLLANSSVPVTAPITITSGTIGGTGTIDTPVSVGTNNFVAPGVSPGTLTFTDDLMLAGGAYLWELGQLSEVTGFDKIIISGSGNTGDFTSGDVLLDFTLLTGAEQPSAALLDTFWQTDREWLIAEAVAGATINSAGLALQNGTGYTDGSFALATDASGNLVLQWDFASSAAVPEAGACATWILIGLALAMCGLRRGRRA